MNKKYDNGTCALTDVSFKIEKNDFVGVLGRNGAGKSTMFKIITGIITDYSGSSNILGKKSTIELAQDISYIPEVRGLDQKGFILEHLTNLLRYKGYSKKDATDRILSWLEKFNMEQYKYQKVGSLSKGNQQKLQLIVALANNPKILILDEPFSGLDLITIDTIWKILLEQQKKGCTVIFSTHEIDEHIANCNKLLFLREGKIVKFGEYSDIVKDFDYVLEIESEYIDIDKVKTIVSSDQIIEEKDGYKILIKDPSYAKLIFETLKNKYCNKFWVRQKTISELFREING